MSINSDWTCRCKGTVRSPEERVGGFTASKCFDFDQPVSGSAGRTKEVQQVESQLAIERGRFRKTILRLPP